MSVSVRIGRAAIALLLAVAMMAAAGDRAEAAVTLLVPADYPTIQEAIDAAEAGDTILVAPGTHVGEIEVATSGVTVESSSGQGLTTIDLDGRRVRIRQEAQGFVLQGFTIRNGQVDSDAPDTIIRGNSFVDTKVYYTQPLIHMKQGGAIEANLFTDVRCESIAELDGGTSFINNLLIDNPSCSGLTLDDASTALILNNTMVNMHAGFRIHSDTDAVIRNNILTDSRYAFRGLGGTGLPAGLRSNLFWRSPLTGVSTPDPVGWNGNIGLDPRFTELQPGSLKYGLKPSSPAIDAGIGGGALHGDFFGGNRRVDGDGDGSIKIDMGAIEYNSGIARIAGMALYPTGTPALAACVTAWEVGGPAVAATLVESTGRYSLVLQPGSYQVSFGSCGTTDLVTTWFGGPTRTVATIVTLSTSEILGGVGAMVSVDPSVLCNSLPVTILGTDDADVIVGTAGADVISTRAGNDDVTAGRGTDTVCGGDGNDVIYGNQGSDTLLGDKGVDKIFGGTGHDQLIGGWARDHLHGEWGRDMIEGGFGDDHLWGGPGDDNIMGEKGNDSFYSEIDDGNDTYDGGLGSTTSYGGDFLVFEGATAVTVDLGAGTSAGRGTDTLTGIEGIRATPGNDILTGNNDNNRLHGLGGDDVISGGAGDDELHGGDGEDTLTGDEGDDRLEGDNGDDTIMWSEGTNRIEGGSDTNTLDLTNAPHGVEIDGALMGTSSIDDVRRVIGSPYADTLRSTTDFDYVDLGAGDDFLVGHRDMTVYGRTGDDRITVRMGSWVHGGLGDDTIKIRNGSRTRSTIYGGSGDDFLAGWYDDETIYGGAGNDTIRGFGGDDTILGGVGNDVIEGDSGSDLILGGAGHDNIAGDGGLDGIIPGPGDDIVDGGTGQDIISYEDADQPVTVNLTAGTATGWGTDTLISIRSVIGGTADDLIIGDALGNGFNGGPGDDEIRGADGNDVMYGWEGKDLLLGGAGNDAIDGGAGQDTAHGKTGTDNCINVETKTGCETNTPFSAFDYLFERWSGVTIGRLIPLDLILAEIEIL